MPGGPYDSSKTRVAPVFDQLRPKTADWVRQLLTLPRFGSPATVPETLDLSFIRGHWGADERGLTPPVSLLSWLIRNLSPPTNHSDRDEHRRRLVARDPEITEKALGLLRSDGTGKAWHVFEGPTYPDALLETPDAIIVVEGKRTESGPTTHTKWMPGRHQMWRHIDAAWEIRGRREVFGFFVVEGVEPVPLEVPRVWREAAASTLFAESLEASLPHRGERERLGIQQAFLGVATWQQVCAHFGIDFEALPDTVSVSVTDEHRRQE